MEIITLKRKKTTGKAVTGTMSFYIGDKKLNYPSLENADFIIPAGKYPIDLTWSPKFKKLLPEIMNVPEREGIRIHMGTIPEHSTGCVLTNAGGVANLQVLFNRVNKTNALKEPKEPDEEVYIEIS